jgi:hypothetical protein
MKSYKYVSLSLILLLSTPLFIFCMEGDFYPLSNDESPSSMIGTTGHQSPAGSQNSIPALSDNSDDDDSLSIYYTPRASLTYTGLENFDARSCDEKDLATILAERPASQKFSISNPELVMGSAVVGFLGSAIKSATPAIRSIRLDENTKTLPIMVTEAAFQLFKACGTEIGLAITLSILLAETRKTIRTEHKNDELRKKIRVLEDAIKNGVIVIKKHERVEQGLVAAEHKVLNDVHQYLRDESELIAKGSQPTQAVATLKAILEKNKKVTKKVVLAMSDLEKIHTEAESLLKKDQKESGIFTPQAWFQKLISIFHKSSNADTEAK